IRTAERFLLGPPLAATYGGAQVAVCDISAKGARIRHDGELPAKSLLKIAVEGRGAPVTLEAMVVWTQADPMFVGKSLSGVRMYGAAELIQALLAHLQTDRKSTRLNSSHA